MLILDVVFAAKPLDPSFGVDQLLLAGEERMAGGADVQTHLLFCRTGLYLVSARKSR